MGDLLVASLVGDSADMMVSPKAGKTVVVTVGVKAEQMVDCWVCNSVG